MSLPVFHYEAAPLDTPGAVIELSGPEGRHAATVKRLGPGERLQLIDGRGAWAEAEVTAASKSSVTLRVTQVGQTPTPVPRVTVVQALPKSERAELAVDLATQAGADAIIPWQADRCVSRWTGPKVAKGVTKWETTALAAAKQSRRTTIPPIADPVNTTQLVTMLQGYAASDTAVLVLHEEAAVPLKTLDLAGIREIFLLIGPEGGIGEEELERLRETGARAVKLGPEVLRTASAAMVALAALGTLTGRW